MRNASKRLEQVDIPFEGNYIVAVSGGVDSVALLHLLASRVPEAVTLRVAHYDHGMRPDSRLDRQLVQDLARILALPFHCETDDLAGATEAQARRARYDFLRRLQKEYEADAIITAHHLDDRLETAVFNLQRGAGRKGAAPLKSVDGILRPLQGVRKADLYEYARHHGLPWREDETNQDISLHRNFIRHELLPVMRTHLPEAEQGLRQLIHRLDDHNAELDRLLDDWLRRHSRQDADWLSLSKKALLTLSPSALEQVLAHLLQDLEPAAQLSAPRLHALMRFVKGAGQGRQFDVSRSLIVVAHADSVAFGRRQIPNELVAQDLEPGSSVRFGQHQISLGNLPNEAAVPVSRLGLAVRRATETDRIAAAGAAHLKKLQDLFTDAKIEEDRRGSWPVIVARESGEVVWVPGIAVSTRFVTSTDTPCYYLTHNELEV